MLFRSMCLCSLLVSSTTSCFPYHLGNAPTHPQAIQLPSFDTNILTTLQHHLICLLLPLFLLCCLATSLLLCYLCFSLYCLCYLSYALSAASATSLTDASPYLSFCCLCYLSFCFLCSLADVSGTPPLSSPLPSMTTFPTVSPFGIDGNTSTDNPMLSPSLPLPSFF